MTMRRGDPCVFGDGKPSVAHGWCSKHYAVARKYGDPLHQVRRYEQQGETCSAEGCNNKPKSHGLCGKCVRRFQKHGETTDPREQLFWSKIDKNGPIPEHRPDLGPCWIYTGYIDPNTGYGQFGGKAGGVSSTRLPHRIAYEYLVGPIPRGLHVDHVCRNRQCVNAANGHLEPVTPRVNIERGDQGAFWGYVPEVVPAEPKATKPTICTEPGCDRPVAKRTLCRPCYRKWLKDPESVRLPPPTPEERFWAKVDKNGPISESCPELGPCWVWTASINQSTGYGRFGPRHGVMVDAHRFSYLLANGSIPDGHEVHHVCHRRRCIRPTHLLAATRSQNLAMRKDRRQGT